MNGDLPSFWSFEVLSFFHFFFNLNGLFWCPAGQSMSQWVANMYSSGVLLQTSHWDEKKIPNAQSSTTVAWRSRRGQHFPWFHSSVVFDRRERINQSVNRLPQRILLSFYFCGDCAISYKNQWIMKCCYLRWECVRCNRWCFTFSIKWRKFLQDSHHYLHELSRTFIFDLRLISIQWYLFQLMQWILPEDLHHSVKLIRSNFANVQPS